MNMLQAGSPAPEFSLPDQNGNLVSLKDLKGKKFSFTSTQKQ